MGLEIHRLSSVGKPLFSWITQRGIQECREACGGHGYLKASRLGELRNENDANCTYEGENNVLIQQTSKWLLNLYENCVAKKTFVTPLGSADFLNRFSDIIESKSSVKTIEETMRPESE